MRLEGVEVDEEQTISEPELLGEIMEIREAVEEASNAPALNKIQSQMRLEVDEEQTASEPELLGEIMEIRETVEEASIVQALKKIQLQMDEKLIHVSDSFANAFRSKQYDEALKSIQRMTYYHHVKEEIVKKL